MRNHTIIACAFFFVIFMATPVYAWSCAGGTCTGKGWAGTGFGNATGAGIDPPDIPQNFPPARNPQYPLRYYYRPLPWEYVVPNTNCYGC